MIKCSKTTSFFLYLKKDPGCVWSRVTQILGANKSINVEDLDVLLLIFGHGLI